MSTPLKTATAHAVELAELGFTVQPAGPKDIQLEGAKEAAASSDPDAVRRLFDRADAANPYVVCGRTGGLLVVDVDGDEGAATFARLEKHLGTLGPPTVITGSGGRHYYRRWSLLDIADPPAQMVGKVGPKVDILGTGDGGSRVFGPGTDRHEWKPTHDRPYRWADGPVVVAELEPLPDAWQAAIELAAGKDRGGLSAIPPDHPDTKSPPQGTHNNTLYRVAVWLRHRGAASAKELLDALEPIATARCDPPYPWPKVEALAANVMRNVKPHADHKRHKRPHTRKGLADAMAEAGIDLRYNVRRAEPEWVRGRGRPWEALDDAGQAGVRFDLKERTETDRQAGFWVASDAAWNRLVLGTADRDRHDPVADYLRDLPPWDGTDRIATALDAVFNVDTRDITPDLCRFVSRFIFMAAAHRATDAGCYAPLMPILTGPQGCGKSTYLEALMPDAFSDSLTFDRFTSAKEQLEQVGDAAIVEAGELECYDGPAMSKMKAFISRTSERFRMSYGRRSVTLPRRFVTIGTTNRHNPIPNDETGGRRFVAVPVSRKVLTDAASPAAWVAARRDQLWAEAMHRLAKGERPMDGFDDLDADRAANLDTFRDADELVESAVAAWLDEHDPDGFTLADAAATLRDGYGLNGISPARAAKALHREGYESRLVDLPSKGDGKRRRRRLWFKPEAAQLTIHRAA